MSDLIERQAAIDVLNSGRVEEDGTHFWRGARNKTIDVVVKIIQALPSAQPEIIRCKDCKHLFDGEHNANCCEILMGKAKWLTEITVDENWYCKDWERRTDG